MLLTNTHILTGRGENKASYLTWLGEVMNTAAHVERKMWNRANKRKE